MTISLIPSALSELELPVVFVGSNVLTIRLRVEVSKKRFQRSEKRGNDYRTPTVLPDITTALPTGLTGATSPTSRGNAIFERPNDSLAGLSEPRINAARREIHAGEAKSLDRTSRGLAVPVGSKTGISTVPEDAFKLCGLTPSACES